MIPHTPIIIPPTQATEHTMLTSAQQNHFNKQIQEIINTNTAKEVSTGIKAYNQWLLFKPLVEHNSDKEYFAASINKVPVSALVLDKLRSGQISLDTIVTWNEADRRGGEGLLDKSDAPLSATVRELLYDMLYYSGNTAVRVTVNELLGGAPAVNETWKTRYNLEHTYLLPLEGPGQLFYLGYTTPSEALKMLGVLSIGPDQYGQFVRTAMATNIWDQMGVRSQLTDPDIILINKIGHLDDPEENLRHDVGIVYNQKTHKSLSYAMMTSSNPNNQEATPQADASLQQIGGLMLERLEQKPQSQPKAISPQSMTLKKTLKIEGKILY